MLHVYIDHGPSSQIEVVPDPHPERITQVLTTEAGQPMLKTAKGALAARNLLEAVVQNQAEEVLSVMIYGLGTTALASIEA